MRISDWSSDVCSSDLHDVGTLLDDLKEWLEIFGCVHRPAVIRVASVEMDDGGTCVGRGKRTIGDLARRYGQMGRHRRCVNRNGDRATDDDLVFHAVDFLTLFS